MRLFLAACTAEVCHSRIGSNQLEHRIAANPEAAEAALNAAEKTARRLWQALVGIEARGMAMTAT